MRIESIEAIQIRSFPPKPRMTSLGLSKVFDYGIVFIRTDDGLEGIGEISMLWDGTGERACYDVNHLLGPVLLGESAFNITRIHSKMNAVIEFSRASNVAKAAIDMALYDLVGKRLDTPVYNLLGGKVRDKIPLSVSIFMDEPERMAERALKFVQEGFKTIKIKVGMDEVRDIEATKEIRAAVGDEVNIRIDANMAWRSVAQAASVIRRLEDYNVHSIEQPMGPERLDDIAALRSRVNTPIMLDESIWSAEDAVRALKADAVDILNVYVSESAGLFPASTIFRIAEAYGIDATIGSMPELGIGTAAHIHLGLSVQSFNCPGDVCGIIYHQKDIIRETIKIEDGHVHALDGPGLGVSIDPDMLKEMRVS